MISIFTYILALITVVPSNNSTKLTDPKEVTWKKTNHDFGKILQGSKVKHTFTLTNTGTTDLLITNAEASCGCTVPSYSKEAVAPGATGTVTVVFDSSNKSGKFTKNITISTNFGSSILGISGDIYIEEAKPKSPVQLGD